jgi:hypothetical protein
VLYDFIIGHNHLNPEEGKMLEHIGIITLGGKEYKLFPLNLGRAKLAAALMRTGATDGVDKPEVAMEVFSKIVALSIQRGDPKVDSDFVDAYAEGTQLKEIVELGQLVLNSSGFELGKGKPEIPAPVTSQTGTESTRSLS